MTGRIKGNVSDDDPEPELASAAAGTSAVRQQALEDIRAAHEWKDAEQTLVAQGFH